jgi:peptide/nickel transport system ATP-binding protein
MKQRIVIAMALAGEPDLIIADEPTTALDVTVQAQIIQILGALVRDRGLALLLITHDMGVVAQVCDRVAVLYAGRLAERRRSAPSFAAPAHPYTAALIGCIPRDGMAKGSLRGIPGASCPRLDYPPGCRFHPRCPAPDLCRSEVTPVRTRRGRPPSPATIRGGRMTDPLIRIERLTKRFQTGGGLLAKPREMLAVRDVSLTCRGEVVGVVGESGCGKSTLARLVLRLIEPTAGRVSFDGTDLTAPVARRLRRMRGGWRWCFRTPTPASIRASRFPTGAGRTLCRPGQPLPRQPCDEMLAAVGLPGRWPEPSAPAFGRPAPARRHRPGAGAAPDFVVLDEPTASLDVSIQAQIIALLADLRRTLGLTYLFISHDLGLVRYFCDRIVVMYLGAVVEVLPDPAARAAPSLYPGADGSAFAPDPRAAAPVATRGRDSQPLRPAARLRLRGPLPPFASDRCRANARRWSTIPPSRRLFPPALKGKIPCPSTS